MKITPYDILEIGTSVSVNGAIGKVIKAEEKRDQFGAPIMVHTIKFEKKYSHKGPHGAVYKPYTKTKTVNYASINTIENV